MMEETKILLYTDSKDMFVVVEHINAVDIYPRDEPMPSGDTGIRLLLKGGGAMCWPVGSSLHANGGKEQFGTPEEARKVLKNFDKILKAVAG